MLPEDVLRIVLGIVFGMMPYRFVMGTCKRVSKMFLRAHADWRLLDFTNTPNIRPETFMRVLGSSVPSKITSLHMPNPECMIHLKGLHLLTLSLRHCSGMTRNEFHLVTELTSLLTLVLPYYFRMTDAELRSLPALANLVHLSLPGCHEVTDEGFRCLGSLVNLQKLLLPDCAKITNAGFECLGSLVNLRDLAIFGQLNEPDELLVHLKHLKLRRLHLGKCQTLTDTGLAAIGSMVSLQSLNLAELPHLTDSVLCHFISLPLLCRLNIVRATNTVTDLGIAYLKSLPKLYDLDLGWCPHITYQGRAYISHLENLKKQTEAKSQRLM